MDHVVSCGPVESRKHLDRRDDVLQAVVRENAVGEQRHELRDAGETADIRGDEIEAGIPAGIIGVFVGAVFADDAEHHEALEGNLEEPDLKPEEEEPRFGKGTVEHHEGVAIGGQLRVPPLPRGLLFSLDIDIDSVVASRIVVPLRDEDASVGSEIVVVVVVGFAARFAWTGGGAGGGCGVFFVVVVFHRARDPKKKKGQSVTGSAGATNNR
mmetsp:Transcript_2433/g.6556  ORF Transcript_2433/g.6556 Transcript_2433/m.6556 type:complete len:212 (-) Transcript_2433:204-839(-)